LDLVVVMLKIMMMSGLWILRSPYSGMCHGLDWWHVL
jgi:hypothetical protein